MKGRRNNLESWEAPRQRDTNINIERGAPKVEEGVGVAPSLSSQGVQPYGGTL